MRKTTVLCTFFFIAAVVFGNINREQPGFKVMSFNIWMGGGRSMDKTAEVIAGSNADIIGIQESLKGEDNTAVRIADNLGWYSYTKGGSETIISRYPIVDTSSLGYGVKIQLDKESYIWMFNVHLYYWPYQPYQLNGLEYGGAPMLNTAEEAVASAWEARKEQILNVGDDIRKVQSEGLPVFLTGDFNEPSYLDWTIRASEVGLCKLPVQWPATKTFAEQIELKDSFRTLHSDEVARPGYTWTSCPSEHEVPDRIDFVLFKGDVIPVRSEIIGEEGNVSDIEFPEYPSDHRAVITTFMWK